MLENEMLHERYENAVSEKDTSAEASHQAHCDCEIVLKTPLSEAKARREAPEATKENEQGEGQGQVP